jgi:hypothetical protein
MERAWEWWTAVRTQPFTTPAEMVIFVLLNHALIDIAYTGVVDPGCLSRILIQGARVQSQAKAIYLNVGSLHHNMKKQAVKMTGAFRKIKPRKI